MRGGIPRVEISHVQQPDNSSTLSHFLRPSLSESGSPQAGIQRCSSVNEYLDSVLIKEREWPQKVYTCEFSRSISSGGGRAIPATRRPTTTQPFLRGIFRNSSKCTGIDRRLRLRFRDFLGSTRVHYRYAKRTVYNGVLNLCTSCEKFTKANALLAFSRKSATHCVTASLRNEKDGEDRSGMIIRGLTSF